MKVLSKHIEKGKSAFDMNKEDIYNDFRRGVFNEPPSGAVSNFYLTHHRDAITNN